MATELNQPASISAEPSADNEFVCKHWLARLVCKGLPFYKEDEGKQYCVLHYPGKEKRADFAIALQKKLEAKDFDFSGVWFPERINFSRVEFSTAANFHQAIFSANVDLQAATFSETANFISTIFCGTINFSSATFSAEASFVGATFRDAANFGQAAFKATADFYSAKFSAVANFHSTRFNALAEFTFTTLSATADFSSATFISYVRFDGDLVTEVFEEKSALSLMHAQIEKSERVTFHTLWLRPHWFVNVDARKFKLVNVRWSNKSIQDEIDALPEYIEYPHRLLSIAYRQLAVNAEENHRYGEASRFRYDSMNVKRLEKWHGWAFWTLDWWYWLASGYGERAGRALIVLLFVLFSFAVLYTQIGFTQSTEKTSSATAATTAQPDTAGRPLRLAQALVYSFEVGLLQKPEPKPLTLTARLLIGLETVLGPLQGALLALAVRRKFMR